MEQEFYPYDFEYKVQGGKSYLYLYSKTKDFRKITVIQEYRPYFYVDVKKANKEELVKKFSALNIEAKPEPAKITGYQELEKELLGKKRMFWKIEVNYPKAVPLIAKELASLGLECYEKDILFIHRYLRDNYLTPLTLTKAEGEFVGSLFYATAIFPVSQETIPWKILAVDIETYAKNKEIDPEKNPVLMLAVYGLDEEGKMFQKVLTWKEFPHRLDFLELVPDEAALLVRFKEIVQEYNPDILTGYYSDGFDLPYLKTRAEKHKISFIFNHSELIIHSSGQETVAKFNGFLHLDVLKFIKYIFGQNLKSDNFSLNSIAEELLSEKKDVVNLEELHLIWDNHPEKLIPFCEYNLQDAYLTLQLTKLLLPDMIEFSRLLGLPLFDVIRMRFSRLVESYILKRGIEFNILAPNKPENYEIEQRMDEHIKGGFVFQPLPGLYEDIAVFDFRSLYPTIIVSHNLGPETFQCSCCQGKVSVPGKKEFWFCQKQKSFLPTVLENLILKRLELKQEIKKARLNQHDSKILEARSYALKILANSFYGYLGFYGARWYSLESAASTTAYARHYIQETIAKAEQFGFKVIYADTDSCFLLLGEKKLEDALQFMKEINLHLPDQMELEFEGHFPRGIFVALKGDTKGAKKKYALLKKDGRLKVTGFEAVRKNWSFLAKELQREVLRLVLENRKKEALQLVRRKVKELKTNKIQQKSLILQTQITRPLNKYTSIGPHVKVAYDLQKRGELISPGRMVKYIISQGTGLVRDRATIPEEAKNYDSEYYIKHQLIPAVSSIFAVFGYSEEDLFKESSQKGLSGWI